MIDGTVPFTEWLPDQTALGNPGLTEAKNVIPLNGDYKPYRPIYGLGDPLGERPRGLIAALDDSGAAFTYAGSQTNLYVRSGVTWVDRSGATYTSAAEDYWRFAQFDEWVIGTNYADVPQALPAGDAGNFADLALTGTAPNARQIGVIGRFVVLGDTEDGTNGVVPHKLQWCAIDDPTNWPTPGSAGAQAVQSGEQFMNSAYGAVTAIHGGDQRGIVFQRSAITRVTYVAGNVVFQFDTIDKSRGARYPNATVQDGDLVYFIAADGFFFTDGVSVIPIGDGKFDKYFADTVDTGYVNRVYGALDKPNGLIYWIYPGPENVSGRPNRVIVYNIGEKRAARAEDQVEIVATGLTSAVTLDGLDAFFSSLDAVTPSLDSSVWQGGNDTLLGFDSTFRLGGFAGQAANAVIETQEVEFSPGNFTLISGIKPLVGGASEIRVSLGTRDDLNDEVSYETDVVPTSRTGVADFRTETRYARARVSVPGTFTYARGLQFDATETGSA